MASRGGGGRKHGRNKKWCERYRVMNTRIKNKRRKLRRHLKAYPNDSCAEKALGAL